MNERHDDDRRAGAADLLPGLRARLEAERSFRGRVRGLPTSVRILVAGAALAVPAAFAAVRLLRPDLDTYPIARFAFSVAACATLALAGAAIFLRPLQLRRLRARTRLVLTAAALLLPAALAVAPAAHAPLASHPESFADRGDAFLGAAARCLLFGSVFAAPLLFALVLADRRDRAGPGRILLAAGAGGLAGNLALMLHCPLVSPSHLLAGHATVPALLALVLTGVAALSGRRCNRPADAS